MNNRRKRPELINLLYESLELLCKQCGLRMTQSLENKVKMQEHMDWHFRQNKRQKDKKLPFSRDWFVSDHYWINETQLKEEKCMFFELLLIAVLPFQIEALDGAAQVEGLINTQKVIPSVKYSGVKLYCPICNEGFEKYYNEEEDEWMIKNAITSHDKIIHFTCSQSNNSSLSLQHSREPSIDLLAEDAHVSKKRKLID